MNNNASAKRRIRLAAGVAVIGLFPAVWFVSRLPVDSIVSALATESPPPGEVLVYTDNSPGSIVTAASMHEAIRSVGHSTVVVLSEGDFTDELPTRNWDAVLVVTRYAAQTPAYAEALRNYVDDGGRAHIFRWRDDPERPIAAASVVLTAGVQHLWMNGFTALTYFKCEGERAEAAVVLDGYVFGDFAGVEPLPPTVLAGTGYEPLAAGAYSPLPQQVPPAPGGAPSPERCAERLAAAIIAALEAFSQDAEDCNRAYQPRPLDNPRFPGNPGKWVECLKMAAMIFSAAGDAAYHRFETCMAIANPSTQPSP